MKKYMQSNDDGVEVDGVRFETLVPERVLRIPRKKLTHKLLDLMKSLSPIPIEYHSFIIPVQIGIRITNNTYTTLRFSFYFTLFPELMGVGGLIPLEGGWISPSSPSNSDFLSVMPGEDVTFFPEAAIFGLWGEQFGLSIATGNSGTWIFQPLNLETYQVRFTYSSKQAMVTIYESVTTNTTLTEDFWSGQISTPFLDFCLQSS